MISNASFQRKVIYGVLIAGLLVPLYIISRPTMRESDGRIAEGGILSQMRVENGLSQANLGENRSHQRDDETGNPRYERNRRQPAVGTSQPLQA